MATSLMFMYLSYIYIFFIDKNEKNPDSESETISEAIASEVNDFRKHWFRILQLALFILMIVTIINMYLKSFLPPDNFNDIMELKNQLGLCLYGIFWIGVILLILSAILSFRFKHFKKEHMD